MLIYLPFVYKYQEYKGTLITVLKRFHVIKNVGVLLRARDLVECSSCMNRLGNERNVLVLPKRIIHVLLIN